MKLETRNVEIRSVDAESREVRGIAVPFNEEIEIWGTREQIAPNSVIPNPAGVKLFWEHERPIGKVTECNNTETGCEIAATISRTALGDEAYELAKDGVINRFSIGFVPQKWEDRKDEAGKLTRTYTEIDLREVSLVAFPAYKTAEVTNVRTDQARKETSEMDIDEIVKKVTAELKPVIAEVRDEANDQYRTLLAKTEQKSEPKPARETRSAGELLKLAVRGKADESATAFMVRSEVDEDMSQRLTRAYEGGKLEDDALSSIPVWVEDLTRLYLAPSPIAHLFQAKRLPSEGMEIQFSRIKSNTLKVKEVPEDQEGEKIATGNITTEYFSKKIRTYAGGSTLTLQEIERSSTDMLNLTLRALAIEAGRERAAYYSKTFSEGLEEAADNALTVAGATTNWTAKAVRHMLIDAAEKMQDTGHMADVLVVNKEVFKILTDFTDSTGRPMMTTQGDGVNSIGTMDIKLPKGQIFHFTILPNFKQPKIGETKIIGGLVTPYAFEKRETPLISLQGTTVLNLSKDFAVYGWGAAALVHPDALIPIKHG